MMKNQDILINAPENIKKYIINQTYRYGEFFSLHLWGLLLTEYLR